MKLKEISYIHAEGFPAAELKSAQKPLYPFVINPSFSGYLCSYVLNLALF